MPTPNDALNYAKRFLGNMPLDDTTIKLRLLDDAHKKLWMAKPWSWTVASLEVVTLVNDQQDVNLVTDYSALLQGLLQVKIINDGKPNDISIASVLPVTTIIKGRPSQVAFVSGSPQKIRLLPVPTGYATLPASQVPKLIATYKKKSPVIDGTSTATSFSTTTGMDDEWFWVYQEIVLLKAFQFTHDPRLGSVQVGPNGTVYSGQYAVVEAAIAEMWSHEDRFFNTLGESVNA